MDHITAYGVGEAAMLTLSMAYGARTESYAPSKGSEAASAWENGRLYSDGLWYWGY